MRWRRSRLRMPREAFPPLVARADATADIGGGHLVRCLALAEAWREAGGTVRFVGRLDGDFPSLLDQAGFPVTAIATSHPDSGDAGVTADVARQIRIMAPPFVVVDGYHFDAAYQRRVRAESQARLICVDDSEGTPNCAADILLNQNVHAADIPYECDPQTVVLAGTRYALLRREFHAGQTTPAENRPGARVLAMFGGSDPAGASTIVLQASDRLPSGVSLDLIVGPGNQRAAELEAAAASLGQRVRVHRNPSSVAALMRTADLAVIAAGSSAWELAALGVPMVVTSVAANQVPIARELERRGAAVDAGAVSALSAGRLADVVQALLSDPGRRARMGSRARQLVDGLGTDRVIAVCGALSAAGPFEWSIRPIAPEDVWQIWRMANDPSVRAHSFKTHRIPTLEHVQWFSSQLADPTVRWWAAQVGGVVAGHVRYARASYGAAPAVSRHVAEVHFSVAAPFRGRGVAAGLLSRTFPLACAELGVESVFGVTLSGNDAAGRTFLRAGYARVERVERAGRGCEKFERRTS